MNANQFFFRVCSQILVTIELQRKKNEQFSKAPPLFSHNCRMHRQKCSNILQLPASHDLTDERWCLSSSYKVITFLHFLNIFSIFVPMF